MRSLETARMILRPWRESDAAALYEHAKDPRIGPMAGWQPHISPEDSLNVIRTILSAEGTLAITLKALGDSPVGSVGYFPATADECGGEPEIGYWIAVPYWGRGLVPEAVREMTRYCFEEAGAQRVWCAHYDKNERSRRVIEKCGFWFAFEKDMPVPAMGETRRELYYSITREAWEPWKAI